MVHRGLISVTFSDLSTLLGLPDGLVIISTQDSFEQGGVVNIKYISNQPVFVDFPKPVGPLEMTEREDWYLLRGISLSECSKIERLEPPVEE